jgi:hypothetical protein
MTRYKERSIDFAELVFGGPLFFVVAAATAAFMAIGLAVITVIDRVFH